VKIEVESVDSKPELDLLTGLIISDKFNQEISPILKIKYLQIPYAKTVARWSIDYYNKYNKSPKKAIQDIFKSKQRENKIDEKQAELIEEFLSNLSKRYSDMEHFNEHFILDESEKYLARRKLEILVENTNANIAQGKIDEAELSVAKHTRTERPSSTSIDVLKSNEIIIDAINEEEDILLKFPGALGEMIGPIARGDFFSYIAPMKRGKTWHLEDFAVRGMMSSLKVLFVSMEMSRNMMIRRLYQNFLGQTKREKEIQIPYFDEDNNVKYKKVIKKGLKSREALKRAKSMPLAVKGGGMRLVCYPSKSVSLANIKTEIYNLEYYEGFYPDVVVLDYLDILAPEPDSPKDYRHRLDHTWSVARGLAQEINGIVVTASQSTRAGFSKDVDEEGVAEDIRKMAHVTHMMALNQNREEKKENVMRASMLASRNEEFQIDDEVVMLYKYDIGKAVIDSRWKKETDY
jgi:hypothetical protein